jgi:hypothetical protein
MQNGLYFIYNNKNKTFNYFILIINIKNVHNCFYIIFYDYVFIFRNFIIIFIFFIYIKFYFNKRAYIIIFNNFFF